ncbi:hypothetical protein E1B28_005499 [Marasmius oreades]|uniref:HNH nuclease domain-containing protein n=1 Tax=Marasmius oreades TaxID=181124 RepID=A0A9P7S3C8_9AGAR|nr:uncharacterized protein E1B28_005499 [Marasmius oreades]KAG7094679.1 hypothetical protein E1B28_005499 [Marasmius oreades]
MASTSSLVVCSPLPEIRTPVPPQHVRFVVWRDGNNMLALDLPVDLVHSVAHKPFKYLVYAAWSICGQRGELRDDQGQEVDMDKPSLSEMESYQYYSPQDVPFAQTVNHALLKQNTKVGSSTGPNYSADFAKNVKERDGACIFTGLPGPSLQAPHIAPLRLGEDFVDNIKTHEVGDLEGINDIRNGITLSSRLHPEYDLHAFAILHVPTPNNILSLVDMKESDLNHASERIRERWFPTTGQRRLQKKAYLFHWLSTRKVENEMWREGMENVAHCAQAAFLERAGRTLPHGGLLHYRYGTSLIVNFINTTVSHGWDALQKKREAGELDGEEELLGPENGLGGDEGPGGNGESMNKDEDSDEDHDEPPEHVDVDVEGPPAQISYSSAREEEALAIQSWFDSFHEVSKSLRKVEEWRNMAQT